MQWADPTGEAADRAGAQLDQLRNVGLAPDAAAAMMRDGLREQRVYLRVGLARGWDKHPDRCYLQLTGVYGFASEAMGGEEHGQR